MPNQQPQNAHFETEVEIDASPEELFDLLDDHRRLSAHMTKRSWMMAGSQMTIEMDEKQGRALGSKISLSGKILGLSLKVEEVVTEYDRPHSKAWKTVGSPRLLVIGQYGMGFSLAARGERSLLRVYIDYSPPHTGVSRLLARLFGKSYAKWCTNRMAHDASVHFGRHQGSI